MRLLLPSVALAQATAPSPAGIAEVERVIVTGSNIPTAEETGPNPVDTYRPSDLEKLGIRNATDLTTFLPQEAGGTVNLNIANGGDGTVQFNLRGLLAKETLVLVDGKRVALGSLNAVGFSGGVDINLLPLPMIDHIDILKDGASAVYGSDAIAGVVNFFLIHKFRGLEIGGSYGNTNLGASNDMGEWEAWIKAGTGDDKTDIVVIADFWERTGGLFSRDRDLSANAFYIPFGGGDARSAEEPGRVINRRLIHWSRRRPALAPEDVFRSRRYSGVRRQYSAAPFSAERGNFSILQESLCGQSQRISRRAGHHWPTRNSIPPTDGH